MLSENDWKLIERTFQIGREELFKQVQQEKMDWGAKCNSNNVFNSGIYTNGIGAIDTKARQKTGELAYLSIEQILRAKKDSVSESEATIIKSQLSKMITQGIGGWSSQSVDTVKKYEAQLEVLILEINAGAVNGNSQMTFNAPVGVVVSPGGSASNFEVMINDVSVAEATKLLDKAIEVMKEKTSDAVLMTQAQEVLNEIKTEIKKPKPNLIKLSSLASGLASTIQTISALKPAYDFIKNAALLFGVALP